MKDAIWPIPNPSRWRDLQLILSELYEKEISEGAKPHVPTLAEVARSLFPGVPEAKAAFVNCLENSPWLLNQIRNSYRYVKDFTKRGGRTKHNRWLKIEPARPTSKFLDAGKSGWNYLEQYLYDDFFLTT